MNEVTKNVAFLSFIVLPINKNYLDMLKINKYLENK